MTDKTHKTFAKYIAECDELAIVPDAAGAFNWAWQAATARAMAEAVRVPDGWQLVPKTHTMDMSVAFAEAFYSRARTVDDDDISDWWDALIAAAPQPKEAL